MSIFYLILFIKFWIIFGINCVKNPKLEWWQTGVLYQVYPRSFKDSDGDGIGDLKGIEEKAQYFKDTGITAIWMSPIYKSPMVDFGYDVSNYTEIDSLYGTMADFESLKNTLHSLGIRIIVDFVPNHSSEQHPWFEKSVKKIAPYTDYYVWKDPKGWNGDTPIPPNNWINQFNGKAWTYREERRQFYYHQFAPEQPDLNYRCPQLVNEMLDIIRFWLGQGVDGIRIDAIPYLVEHDSWADEPPNPNDPHPELTDIIRYDSQDHVYVIDQPETYEIASKFRAVVDEYNANDGESRVMITEAYTDLGHTMKYYGTDDKPAAHIPFNFLFISELNHKSKAQNYEKTIRKWLDNIPPKKWPDWVIGNHDNSRVASRFGKELADGMNMICLLLPGTAFTYYGEEIGMTDAHIRWEQTVDPQGRNVGPNYYELYSRDPERTPFQWDDTENSGFSTNSNTWLPVNPNYWWLNLEDQKNSEYSHYQIYKRLVKLRSTSETIQRGSYNIYAISDRVLAFTRTLEDHGTYIVVINIGEGYERIVLRDNIAESPENVTVHTASLNSQHKIGDNLSSIGKGFTLRPKAAVVLTNEKINTDQNGEFTPTSSAIAYSTPMIILVSFLYIFVI